MYYNHAAEKHGSLDLVTYEHAREAAILDPSEDNLERARVTELAFRRSPMGLAQLRKEGWGDLARAYEREAADAQR